MGAICQVSSLSKHYTHTQTQPNPPLTLALHITQPAAMVSGKSHRIRTRRCGLLNRPIHRYQPSSTVVHPSLFFLALLCQQCCPLGQGMDMKSQTKAPRWVCRPGWNQEKATRQACTPDQTGAGNNLEAFAPCFRILVSAYYSANGWHGLSLPTHNFQWPQLN